MTADLWRHALGVHWLLDAWGCEKSELATLDTLESALLGLCETLGLTRVGSPQLCGPDSGSLMGIVLISESHLSLHAYPSTGRLHADLFSCAPFDPKIALAYLRKTYAFDAFEERLVRRGERMHSALYGGGVADSGA
ncbi:MAG: S-adenosylmethionine decarboxylase [Deltaproteobacteria bacterium]|nr:S-adenosylmethionine decarboxylase [Deltaproteobacteria bacterium]